jgi:2-oxoglutarate ferredoxin oxidoreductase subunit delta
MQTPGFYAGSGAGDNHPSGRTTNSCNTRKGCMAKPKLKEHVINREWCKGCGICVAFCPKKVLELDRHEKAVAARPEDCIACRLCELRCPDLAIEIITE